jgi:enoyl-CoA hydratase/carnithine racemase
MERHHEQVEMSRSKSFADGLMLAEIDGPVGTVVFNQPEKHNAVTVEMWIGLGEIIAEMEADPAVRVVVLRGAGEKAFVSGADISQFDKTRANADVAAQHALRMAAGRGAVKRCSKPTIAAIRGYCLGGGLGIALQADLRIAATDSQFGIPAARLGIAYAFEGLRTLVDAVGPAHARMIMFSANRIDAAEAERIGLINRAVPADKLWDEVGTLAARIASNAPISVAASKAGIDMSLRDADQRDLALLEEFQRRSLDSADYREGRAAFKEKRQPVFTGR